MIQFQSEITFQAVRYVELQACLTFLEVSKRASDELSSLTAPQICYDRTQGEIHQNRYAPQHFNFLPNATAKQTSRKRDGDPCLFFEKPHCARLPYARPEHIIKHALTVPIYNPQFQEYEMALVYKHLHNKHSSCKATAARKCTHGRTVWHSSLGQKRIRADFCLLVALNQLK